MSSAYSLHLVAHASTSDYLELLLRIKSGHGSIRPELRYECKRIVKLSPGDTIQVAVACADRDQFVREAAQFIADTLRSDVQFDDDYAMQATAYASYLKTVTDMVEATVDGGDESEDLMSSWDWPYKICVRRKAGPPEERVNGQVLWFYSPVRLAIEDDEEKDKD